MKPKQDNSTFYERFTQVAPPLQVIYLSPMIDRNAKSLTEVLELNNELKRLYSTEEQAKRILDSIPNGNPS